MTDKERLFLNLVIIELTFIGAHGQVDVVGLSGVNRSVRIKHDCCRTYADIPITKIDEVLRGIHGSTVGVRNLVADALNEIRDAATVQAFKEYRGRLKQSKKAEGLNPISGPNIMKQLARSGPNVTMHTDGTLFDKLCALAIGCKNDFDEPELKDITQEEAKRLVGRKPKLPRGNMVDDPCVLRAIRYFDRMDKQLGDTSTYFEDCKKIDDLIERAEDESP